MLDIGYLRKKDLEINSRANEKKTKMAEHKIPSPSELFFVLDEDTKNDPPGEGDTGNGLNEDFIDQLNEYQADDAEGLCLMSEIGLWSLQNCRGLAKMDPTYKQITNLLMFTRHIEIMFGGILDQRQEHIKLRALHATLWQKILNSGTFLCHYRPQRSWAKVIFSEACVKNSVRGEACMGSVGMCGVHGRGGVADGHAW